MLSKNKRDIATCLRYSFEPAPRVYLFVPLSLRPSELFSNITGHEMKDVKPTEPLDKASSCNSLTLPICSNRCKLVSPKPITLVAEVVRPNSWASRITCNQFSAEPFFGEISRRTSSTNISAPPPGKPCIPAARSSSRT